MKSLNKIIIIALCLVSTKCLDDSLIEPVKGNLNATAELIRYFEGNGDYANSQLSPALISADELFSNLTAYLVIDIRDESYFDAGHIQGSASVPPDSLINFLTSLDISVYQKIVIVDINGQASAYYCCLLRLIGFDKIFSLNFGLASWNNFFADDWLNALDVATGIFSYTNDVFEKGELSELPIINFTDTDATIEKKAEERVNQIISEGFSANVVFRDNVVVTSDEYLFCYAPTPRAYFAPRFITLAELGHPYNTSFYHANPVFELRTTNALQTLPSNKKILLYDVNGQLAASMCAYLRAVGYDTSFLIYGAHTLFYPRLLDDPELISYAFSESLIRNYPYTTN